MAIEQRLPRALPSDSELPRRFDDVSPPVLGLARHWQYERVRPPGGDGRLGALARTAFHLLGNQEPHWEPTLAEAFSIRPERPAAEVARRVAQALQQQELGRMALGERTGPHYPQAFLHRSAWRDAIRTALSTEKSRARFGYELLLTPVTNVADRYVSLQYLGRMQQARTGVPPRILDVGCSQLLGLKKLSMQSEPSIAQPFKKIRLDGGRGSGRMQFLLNGLLARPFELGYSSGVDLHEPKETIDRVRSSFRPGELLDPGVQEQFDLLAEADPPHVGFLQGDFSEFHDGEDGELSDRKMRQAIQHNGGEFDIASFLTVLYQCTPWEQDAMFANALKYTTGDAFVVIQDFIVQPEPGKVITRPSEMTFADSWDARPYTYSTWVFDKGQPERGFQEFMCWGDGRCTKLQIPKVLSPVHAELNLLLRPDLGPTPTGSAA